MTTIPLRVRAWGWFMNRFRSMHIASMSSADIEHNQTMRHVPTIVRRLLFGARDRSVTVDDRMIPPAPHSSTPIPVRIYRPRAGRIDRADRTGTTSTRSPRAGRTPTTTTPTTPPATTTPRTGSPAPTTPHTGSPAPTTAPLPIALYFHGGGWTLFGGLDMCDWLPSRVASRLGAIVVAVDYRLAPQHPFPAAVDDSYAALEWVAAHAVALGADPGRLAVIGDSAGGNLACAVALLARDRRNEDTRPRHGGPPAAPQPAAPLADARQPAEPRPDAPRTAPHIAAQLLIYPVTDTTLDDDSMRTNARSPVLHRADMAAFLDYYLGPDPHSPLRSDVRVAPQRASSLADLPPTQIQLGAHDVLRDQGLAYGASLAAAATPCEVKLYPEAPHGWVTYPTIMRTAKTSLDDGVDFLRRHLG